MKQIPIIESLQMHHAVSIIPKYKVETDILNKSIKVVFYPTLKSDGTKSRTLFNK